MDQYKFCLPSFCVEAMTRKLKNICMELINTKHKANEFLNTMAADFNVHCY